MQLHDLTFLPKRVADEAGRRLARAGAMARAFRNRGEKRQSGGIGSVRFVGAGPGDPDLLTVKAWRALGEADVVIHDRLVPQPILDLAAPQASLVPAGKEGFGSSVPQERINALIVNHARSGAARGAAEVGRSRHLRASRRRDRRLRRGRHRLVGRARHHRRLGRGAALGQGLTRRGRNSGLRILTGHDVEGFAEHDWRELARPGAVAAIYMGKRGARFLQGRLLMHGADPATPSASSRTPAAPTSASWRPRSPGWPRTLAAAALRRPRPDTPRPCPEHAHRDGPDLPTKQEVAL